MRKQELIIKIEQHFGKGTKFYEWLGYSNAKQNYYAFKKNKKINLMIKKIIELLDEITFLKNKEIK